MNLFKRLAKLEEIRHRPPLLVVIGGPEQPMEAVRRARATRRVGPDHPIRFVVIGLALVAGDQPEAEAALEAGTSEKPPWMPITVYDRQDKELCLASHEPDLREFLDGTVRFAEEET